jgi:hypothetical protein
LAYNSLFKPHERQYKSNVSARRRRNLLCKTKISPTDGVVIRGFPQFGEKVEDILASPMRFDNKGLFAIFVKQTGIV